MNPVRFLLLLLGIGVTAMTAVLVVSNHQQQLTLPIPTLSLLQEHAPRSSFLGQVAGPQINIWSEVQTASGIILPADDHNWIRCASPGPAVGPLLAQDVVTRFWAYEYEGNETTKQNQGLTGRALFSGRFAVSQGERQAGIPVNRYDWLFGSPPISTTGILASTDYYAMLETDLYYRCNLGIEYICGNGIVEAGEGEQCDDANRTNGDGCGATCQNEGGGSSSSSSVCPFCFSTVLDGFGDHISIPDPGASSLDLSGNGSIALWVKSNGLQNPAGAGLVVKSPADGGAINSLANYYILVSGNTLIAGITGTQVSTTVPLTPGTWQHVLLTWNGSTVSLYLDANPAVTSPQAQAPSANTSPLFIGRRQYFSGSPVEFNGSVDDVRLFNRALSSLELINILSGIDVTNGLVGRWKLDEGSGTTAFDASGTNHGTLQDNASWSSDVHFAACDCTPASSSSSSSASPVCGNGLVEIGEACDDNNVSNGDGCSDLCEEETNFFCTGEPSQCEFVLPGLPGISLQLDMKNIGANLSTTAGANNIPLLRVDVTAGISEDITPTAMIFEAQSGSLANIERFSAWVDTNGDDIVDAIIQNNVVPVGGFVAFTSSLSIPAGQTFALEIHGDVADTLTGSPAQLRLRFAETMPGFIEAQFTSDGTPLSGIKVNSVCSDPICEIFLSTLNAPLWTFTP